MKKRLITFCAVAVVGVAVPPAFVGCASDTDTHKRTTGQYIDDKVLVQRVKGALNDNDIYKFPDVKVNTYKGTVQLSGFVESDEQKRKAEEIARNVQGVYAVQNNIGMKADTERVRGDVDRTITTNRNTTAPRTNP